MNRLIYLLRNQLYIHQECQNEPLKRKWSMTYREKTNIYRVYAINMKIWCQESSQRSGEKMNIFRDTQSVSSDINVLHNMKRNKSFVPHTRISLHLQHWFTLRLRNQEIKWRYLSPRIQNSSHSLIISDSVLESWET